MNVGDTKLHSSCIHKTIVVQNILYVQALCCVPLGYSVNNRTPLLMTKNVCRGGGGGGGGVEICKLSWGYKVSVLGVYKYI